MAGRHIITKKRRGGELTELFFLPADLVPEGVGFSLFGVAHMAFLALSAALCAGLCAAFRRGGAAVRRRLRRGVGAAILACEALKTANLIVRGVYGVYYLPLHLCSMAVFFCFFHSLRPRETLGNFIYSTCMPGAAFALLFPDWTALPPWSLHCILGFAVHALLVAYPLMLTLGGELVPSVRLLPRCFVMLASLAAAVYCVDRAVGANYMFLLWPAAGSPLEWFASWLGVPCYIFGYIPMLLLVWTLLYLPFRRKASA